MSDWRDADDSLVGNGQPGRIALLERTVEELKRWRWWVVGAAAGAAR